MDWIERIFHVSPDGGNGFIEAMILGAFVLVIFGVVWTIRVRRRRSRERVQAKSR